MTREEVYVSTDIETDGPVPGLHSMLSFGSVALLPDKTCLGTFEINLDPLPEASPDPATMAWWATIPEAWAYCRNDPQPPLQAMTMYLQWLRELDGPPVFVGYSAAWDFAFVHYYLVRFTGQQPFQHSALDIKTYAMALMKKPYLKSTKRRMPKRWFGPTRHSHRALDDAIGQGELFLNMFAEDLTRAEERQKES